MKSKVKLQSLTPFIGIKGDNVEVYRRGLEFKNKVELPERTIRAKISTTTVDSEGDVLLPKGCDYGRYQKNPVVYWNHDYKQLPIGKITKMVIEDEYIQADIQFAETSLAEEVYALIKGGFLNCNSIGFVIKKAFLNGTRSFVDFTKTLNTKVEQGCKRIIAEYELIENSIVGIPSNPEALIEAVSSKSIKVSDITLKELGIKMGDVKKDEKADEKESGSNDDEVVSENGDDKVDGDVKKDEEQKETGKEQVRPLTIDDLNALKEEIFNVLKPKEEEKKEEEKPAVFKVVSKPEHKPSPEHFKVIKPAKKVIPENLLKKKLKGRIV